MMFSLNEKGKSVENLVVLMCRKEGCEMRPEAGRY